VKQNLGGVLNFNDSINDPKWVVSNEVYDSNLYPSVNGTSGISIGTSLNNFTNISSNTSYYNAAALK
jgi:hypothetical protein